MLRSATTYSFVGGNVKPKTQKQLEATVQVSIKGGPLYSTQKKEETKQQSPRKVNTKQIRSVVTSVQIEKVMSFLLFLLGFSNPPVRLLDKSVGDFFFLVLRCVATRPNGAEVLKHDFP